MRTENGEGNGSASQTLSDLAAAASNRLMAENAAEVAAAVQNVNGAANANSSNLSLTYSDRTNLLGALRSSRDPFLGSGFDPTTSRNTGLNTNSVAPNSHWATSEEMEVIQQSQFHQLGTRAFPDPRSPPPIPSDIQSIIGREYNSSFSHSPESSFVEVGGSGK